MPIQVQLWRGQTLLVNRREADKPAASAAIDEILTEVHAARHGEAVFTLEADYVTDAGVYLGSFYRVPELPFPALPAPPPTPATAAPRRRRNPVSQ